MTLFRNLCLIASVLSAAPVAASEAGGIAGADIIDRVDRVLRVSPATARTWHAGVANLDTWPARLERALIETLGPTDLRQTEAGLQTLRTLLEEGSPDAPLTGSAHDALAVIVKLIERQAALAQERDRIQQALEHERKAHRQTTDKLNALRQIDHQLDERANDGGR